MDFPVNLEDFKMATVTSLHYPNDYHLLHIDDLLSPQTCSLCMILTVCGPNSRTEKETRTTLQREYTVVCFLLVYIPYG